jgi:hypothetical protein
MKMYGTTFMTTPAALSTSTPIGLPMQEKTQYFILKIEEAKRLERITLHI